MVEHALGAVRVPAGARAEEAGDRSDEPLRSVSILWSAAAEERLRRIPIPAIRRMVLERVEAHAREQGLTVVDLDAYEVALGK